MKITSKQIKSDVEDIRIPAGLKLDIDIGTVLLNQTEVVVRPNYYDGFAQEARPVQRALLSAYLRDDGKFPTDDLCPEMPVPEKLAEHIKLTLPKSMDAGSHAIALLHAGRKGCIAPMHFDWDHDNVLHACVSGTRTFFLFPPSAGWLLSPVVNTSALCFARMSSEDQKQLLKMLGGQKIVLHPGEAVLFPSMWWHCVYYDTASVGISVRFADRKELRPFCVLPRSWWLQRVVAHMFAKRMPAKTIERLFTKCATILFTDYPHWSDRYHAFASWCRTYLHKVGEQKGIHYWVDEAFNPELVLAGTELEELYTIPLDEKEREKVPEIKRYLFEAFPALRSKPVADVLARYALTTRNGLPAKRGLVPIVYETKKKRRA